MKPAIIFDMDGTIWDAMGCIYPVWKAASDRHPELGITINEEVIKGILGKTMARIADELMPNCTESEKDLYMDEVILEENSYLEKNGAIIYDGFFDVMKELHAAGYPLMIVSNAQDGYAQAFLNHYGVGEYFLDFELYGRTELEKGDNIKLIMQRNNIEKAVYVGDTLGDEEACKVAKVPFIYASYGFGEAQNPAATISSIKELPECIKMFN